VHKDIRTVSDVTEHPASVQDIKRNVSERPKGRVHKDIRTVSDVTERPASVPGH
jgi:hypothetical protein